MEAKEEVEGGQEKALAICSQSIAAVGRGGWL